MRNKYDNIVYGKSFEVQLNESFFKNKEKEVPKIKFDDEMSKVIYSTKSILAEILNDTLERYREYFNLLKVSEIAEDYDKLRYTNRLCICRGKVDSDLSDSELKTLNDSIKKAYAIATKKMPKGYKLDIREDNNTEYKFFIITPDSVSKYIEESAISKLQYLAEKHIPQVPYSGYIKPVEIDELAIQLEMTDVTDTIEIGTYDASKFSKYYQEKEVYTEFAKEVENVLEAINSQLEEGYYADIEGSWEKGSIVIKEGIYKSPVEEGFVKNAVDKTKEIFTKLKEKIKDKFTKEGKRKSIEKKEFEETYKSDMVSLARQLRSMLPEENKIEEVTFNADEKDLSSSKNISFGKYDFREYSKENPEATFEEYTEHIYKLIDNCYSVPDVKDGPYEIEIHGGKVDGVITLMFKPYVEFVEVEESHIVEESLLKELINTTKNYYKNRKERRRQQKEEKDGIIRVSDEEFKEKYLDDLISQAKKLRGSLPEEGYIRKADEFEEAIEMARENRSIDFGTYDITDYADNFRDETVMKKFYDEVDKKVTQLNSQISGPYTVMWDGDWDDGGIIIQFDVRELRKGVRESFDGAHEISAEVYNFSELILAVTNLIQGNVNATEDIREELNRFFTDAKCTDVIFTNNTDGSFFGLYVQPFISIGTIDNIIYNNNDEIEPIKEYRLEIDSKLLNLTGSLTIDEITAVILNDVSNVLGSSKPLVQISNAYQIAQANLYSDVSIGTSTNYLAPVHRFAISRTVRELTSIFAVTDEEFISNEMAVKYGYNASLESAFNKLKGSSYIMIGKACACTLIKWACTVADEITDKRRGVLNMIDDALSTSGSVLEKEEFRDLVETIERQNRFVTESFGESRRIALTENFFKKVKIKGLRSIEDDLYEYKVRTKNIDSENDALIALRGINYRLNMLEDYMLSKGLNEYDKERCQDLITKFRKLRDDLMEMPAYKDRFIGLFVDAPVRRGQLIF